MYILKITYTLIVFFLTGFGIGTVIYSGLQFGQYWELSTTVECNMILKALKPMFRIIFGLMQMLFIFSYSNVSFNYFCNLSILDNCCLNFIVQRYPAQ